MAKFRNNHRASNRYTNANAEGSPHRGGKSSKKTLARSIFFFVGILILLYYLSGVETDSWEGMGQQNNSGNNVELSDQKGSNITTNFYPESTTGQVIEHKHYALSYSEEHEQAEWVAYQLKKEDLRKPRVKREKKFRQDDRIQTLSAKHSDYSHSGYTRGHLAPAGDMAFSKEAMRESFFMSNMSPQVKEFNGGIWRELEENVRDWAFDNDELYIVTGPVLTKENIITQIGYNEVSVPKLFYKIILDLKEPEQKSIAFLMPNTKSTSPIQDYIVSIDEIESMTGIDFFADFLPADQEAELEQKGNERLWEFDRSKFKKRLEKWNNY